MTLNEVVDIYFDIDMNLTLIKALIMAKDEFCYAAVRPAIKEALEKGINLWMTLDEYDQLFPKLS